MLPNPAGISSISVPGHVYNHQENSVTVEIAAFGRNFPTFIIATIIWPFLRAVVVRLILPGTNEIYEPSRRNFRISAGGNSHRASTIKNKSVSGELATMGYAIMPLRLSNRSSLSRLNMRRRFSPSPREADTLQVLVTMSNNHAAKVKLVLKPLMDQLTISNKKVRSRAEQHMLTLDYRAPTGLSGVCRNSLVCENNKLRLIFFFNFFFFFCLFVCLFVCLFRRE
jgi:hypothetical protein